MSWTYSEAGINVIGEFNVQHLESLKDIVERVTGVNVRETIPDTFLQQADQVVNLDLAIEDLIDRLQAGKIYAADKVSTALANFFQAQNLSTLRELALREVAESVDRTTTVQNRAHEDRPENRRRARDGLFGVRFATLRRSVATRLAPRRSLKYGLVCCLCGNPEGGAHLIDAEAQRRLYATIQKATELGAADRAVEGQRSRTSAHQFRPLARSGIHCHRAVPPGPLETPVRTVANGKNGARSVGIRSAHCFL